MVESTEGEESVVYGICAGAVSVVCVDSAGELLRNELGGYATTAYVGFSSEGRKLGEAAVMGYNSNAKGTATDVTRLAVLPYDSLVATARSRHWQWPHQKGADGQAEGALGGHTLSATSLLGALLGKCRATSAPMGGSAPPPLSIALPACTSAGATAEELSAARDAARAALVDAATVGGWKLVAAPTTADCLGSALARKWPFTAADKDGPSRHVLVVDMGAQSCHAAVFELKPPSSATDDAFHAGTYPASAACVAEASDADLGASAFDKEGI